MCRGKSDRAMNGRKGKRWESSELNRVYVVQICYIYLYIYVYVCVYIYIHMCVCVCVRVVVQT